MHYAILAFGLLLGAWGLYRFFKTASPKQMAALFLTAIAVVLLIAVFFMAVTGRLPAAIALLVALFPLLKGFVATKNMEHEAGAGRQRTRSADQEKMSVKEALEVLGLEETPTAKAVKDAHKKLIRKVHPDQEGSAWLAAKINTARDVLLEKTKD